MEPTILENLSNVVTPAAVGRALAIFVAAWLILRLLGVALRLAAERLPRYRLRILATIPIVGLMIWPLALYLVIMHALRPPEATVYALLGAAGLAIGLAIQEPLRNAIAGILLIVYQPFKLGDLVRVGEHYGEVIEINLMTVRLRSFNDDTIVLPTAAVVGGPVVNSNSGNVQAMVSAEVRVPPGVDLGMVRRQAWEAAMSSPYVDLGHPVSVLFEDEYRFVPLTRVVIKAYVLDARLERLLVSDIVRRLKPALEQQQAGGPGIKPALPAAPAD